jgi:putative ABC transport system permease protein
MDAVRRDIRYALRTLGRSPAFTSVAVLTLALGIGATTAIFSVIYGVLLRPLPYGDADRLVRIDASRNFYGDPAANWNYSYIDLEDWQTRSRSFESIAFMRGAYFALSGDGRSEQVFGAAVSGDFFVTVPGTFVLGRPLMPGDDESSVAVISERLWNSRYARSMDIVGKEIKLNGRPYTVVGVVAADFQLPDRETPVWVPAVYLDGVSGTPTRRGQGGYNLIARLEPNVTIAQAQSDADNVSRELAREYPEAHGGTTAKVVGLRAALVATVRPALLVLFAAVGLMLVVAYANVANLLLARALSQSRQTAIRAALGASRLALVRQSLIESAALAMAGCVVGVLLALSIVRTLVWLEPGSVPRLDAIHVDRVVLTFAMVLALLTSIAVGLVPGLHGASGISALKGGSGIGYGVRGRRLRQTLVIAQLAVSTLLVVGAVLLGRSLVRLMTTDLGVPTDHVAAVLVDVNSGRQLARPQTLALIDRVIDRVRSEPGVEMAAVSFSLPPNLERLRSGFELPDPATGRPAKYLIGAVPVSPEFFSTLRVPLVKGRLFNDSDGPQSQLVMILSAQMARRFFGSRDPLGQTLPVGQTGEPDRKNVTIIGVVGDVHYVGLDAAAGSTFYVPFAQMPLSSPFIVARTAGDPEIAVATMQRAVTGVDPDILIIGARTLDGFVSAATAQPRYRTLLLVAIAALAFIVAAIGLYGVTTYSVAQRTNEIGIRVAVGATPARIAALVLREGLTLALAGTIIGVAGAYMLRGLLAALLYGITPADPLSFILASACLLVVAALASYLPARRAARVDPLVALRAE